MTTIRDDGLMLRPRPIKLQGKAPRSVSGNVGLFFSSRVAGLEELLQQFLQGCLKACDYKGNGNYNT